MGMSAERGKILGKAREVINGARQDRYGDAEDSFRTIGDMWSAYLNAALHPDPMHVIHIGPHDVAMLLALLKVGRIAHGAHSTDPQKMDSYVDLAGYTALAADMVRVEQSFAEALK